MYVAAVAPKYVSGMAPTASNSTRRRASVPRRAYCHSPTTQSGSCMTRLVPYARCSSCEVFVAVEQSEQRHAKTPPLTPRIPDKMPITKPSAIPTPMFSIAPDLNGCARQSPSPARTFRRQSLRSSG
jgi:hypothetical protein